MIDIPAFTPSDWYWIVGGDTSRAWSSAAGSYVSAYPATRITRIANETELADVLRLYGLSLPVITEQDYAAAIQSHIDATAKAKGYADGVGLASYTVSTNPAWAAEATLFVSWRDAVWAYAYAVLGDVQSGLRPAPTIAGLIAELPGVVWP